MAELHRQFEEAGGTTAFHARVLRGSVGGPAKRLRVQDAGSGEEMELTVAAVVNAAGLHAQARAAARGGQGSAACPSPLCCGAQPRCEQELQPALGIAGRCPGMAWCSARMAVMQLPMSDRLAWHTTSPSCRPLLPPCKACPLPPYRPCT